MCRARLSLLETPIFSPEFPFRGISFSQIPSPFYIFWRILPFRRPSFSNFRLAVPRVSSRPERQPDASWQFQRVAFPRSKRIKLVPEPRMFKLMQARSGAPHFHARPGAHSGPIFHFAAAHTPPPPPPGCRRLTTSSLGAHAQLGRLLSHLGEHFGKPVFNMELGSDLPFAETPTLPL